MRKTRRGGQPSRLDRRLTREEADGLLGVLRGDRSAAAAINVLQDLLRYNIQPSARANLPVIINTIRANTPDLSTPISQEQRAILEQIVESILIPIIRQGGKKTRKNRRHK